MSDVPPINLIKPNLNFPGSSQEPSNRLQISTPVTLQEVGLFPCLLLPKGEISSASSGLGTPHPNHQDDGPKTFKCTSQIKRFFFPLNSLTLPLSLSVPPDFKSTTDCSNNSRANHQSSPQNLHPGPTLTECTSLTSDGPMEPGYGLKQPVLPGLDQLQKAARENDAHLPNT